MSSKVSPVMKSMDEIRKVLGLAGSKKRKMITKLCGCGVEFETSSNRALHCLSCRDSKKYRKKDG